MADRIGQLLGHYRIIRLLGQGGFADVYLAEHIHLNTLVAIKVLRTQLVEESIENFRTEARTVAHLIHPNIVRVLDFGVESGTPFLVMEHAPNGTLRQRHARGVPLPVEVIVPYVKQVAAALQYAHNQKLIHRDIKPENMLLGSNNEVLLSDFGIAVLTQSARAQNPADQGAWDPAGTVAYMAPEQIQGKTVPASDQYALAIVVSEWLTGVLPFNGSYMEIVSQQIAATPPSLRAEVPTIAPDVEQVVLTALAKDLQKRFGRIEAFAHALEQAAQSQSKPSVPVSQPLDVAFLPKRASEVPAMEASLIGPLGRTILGSTELTIGRAADNNLIVTDSRASSHHAEIRPQGQYYSIVDLGSTNGTFVNEQQIYAHAPRPLQRGDTIRIGDTKFSFEVASSAQSGALSSDGSTVRATPPPLSGAAPPNFGGNTSYGGGAVNYGGMQSSYGGTIPAQPQPPSYTPSQPLQVSETQIPTYTPPLYRQPDQHPAYTPPPYTPPQENRPSYTPTPSQPPYAPQHFGAQSSYTPTPFQPPYTPQPPGAQPFYTPSQPPQSRKLGSRVRAIIFAVVALVIILGGVGTFFVIHGQQVQQQNINATATAQSQANADASATAHVLATQNAVATATAQVTSHYPPFTNLALNDSLTSNSSSQWSSSSICQFTSAGYQVSIAQVGYFQWCLAKGTTFSDLAYQVTMTTQQGDCGGLVFRYVDSNNFYLLEVCQNGTYNIGDFVNGKASYLYSSATSSSAIQQGVNQSNMIAVTVQGDTVNVYVNGQRIDTATSNALTSSSFSQGAIGVLADDQTNPTSVLYTHALVWTAS